MALKLDRLTSSLIDEGVAVDEGVAEGEGVAVRDEDDEPQEVIALVTKTASSQGRIQVRKICGEENKPPRNARLQDL